MADERGYDICSTDQCQVYRGATVELGAFGERWVRAVEGTRGRVLTYGGSVIQAFYFSTSDGRTRRSFPGGTAQPWLPSVRGYDEDAPLARWTARIRVRDLDEILERWDKKILDGAINGLRVSDESLVIRTGSDGRAVVPLTQFRSAVNSEAPCVDPERYPAPRGSALGTKLPQTVPSTSFTIDRSGDDLILRGRGWGHFVGMSQWGANALAERGRGERQILKHYYGPADLERVREPERIRVLAAEGMRVVRIAIDGPVRVRTGTGSRLEPAGAFEVRGGDALRISRGKGPSLAPVLSVSTKATTLAGEPGSDVSVPLESSRAVRVRTEILSGRTVVARTPERSLESGERSIDVPLIDDDGAPLRPGRYDLIVEAFDGLDRIRTKPVAVTVLGPTPSATPQAAVARDDGDPARLVPLLVAALALLLAAGLWLRARISRR